MMLEGRVQVGDRVEFVAAETGRALMQRCRAARIRLQEEQRAGTPVADEPQRILADDPALTLLVERMEMCRACAARRKDCTCHNQPCTLLARGDDMLYYDVLHGHTQHPDESCRLRVTDY
jgi:hypothetical protein